MSQSDEEYEDPTKIKRVLTEINEFEEVRYIRTEKFYTQEELNEYALLGKKPKKYYEMPVRGLGMKPGKLSSTGIPSVDADTIQELVNGRLEKELSKTRDEEFVQGLKKALECWLEMKRIETLMTTFIASLIQSVDPKGTYYFFSIVSINSLFDQYHKSLSVLIYKLHIKPNSPQTTKSIAVLT
jgi:uncharacterized membrane-anchored protein YjiN (DUF445 family)